MWIQHAWFIGHGQMHDRKLRAGAAEAKKKNSEELAFYFLPTRGSMELRIPHTLIFDDLHEHTRMMLHVPGIQQHCMVRCTWKEIKF
jgi:hypothetical protein